MIRAASTSAGYAAAIRPHRHRSDSTAPPAPSLKPSSGRVRELHQLGNLLDVDDQVGLAQSLAQLHDQVGAAGEHPGPLALGRQQTHGLVDGGGRLKLEILHVRVPAKAFRIWLDPIRSTINMQPRARHCQGAAGDFDASSSANTAAAPLISATPRPAGWAVAREPSPAASIVRRPVCSTAKHRRRGLGHPSVGRDEDLPLVLSLRASSRR